MLIFLPFLAVLVLLSILMSTGAYMGAGGHPSLALSKFDSVYGDDGPDQFRYEYILNREVLPENLVGIFFHSLALYRCIRTQALCVNHHLIEGGEVECFWSLFFHDGDGAAFSSRFVDFDGRLGG